MHSADLLPRLRDLLGRIADANPRGKGTARKRLRWVEEAERITRAIRVRLPSRDPGHEWTDRNLQDPTL